jgi:hypothetical protein
MALLLVAWIALSRGGVDVTAKPLGTDFICFWTSSQMALHGHPASAYDTAASIAAQRRAFPTIDPGYTAFFYPPTFLLVCLPLALLPYLWSLALWLGAGLAVVVACLRRLLPARWALLPTLAYPGLLINAGHGQNGYLSAACFGGFMLWGDRRPFVAGACLGLLVCKPHLLAAAPVALLAARRWRAIAGALLSSLTLVIASLLVFGEGAWRAFLGASTIARQALELGALGPDKMVTLFAAVRLLHGSVALAYALQAASALIALVLLAGSARRRAGAAPEGALLVCATTLCSPYLFDYDLVCVALPLAWVAAQAQPGGWRPWEKIVLLAAFVLPLFSRTLGGFGVPVAPEVLVGMFWVTWRRGREGLLSCKKEATNSSSAIAAPRG